MNELTFVLKDFGCCGRIDWRGVEGRARGQCEVRRRDQLGRSRQGSVQCRGGMMAWTRVLGCVARK